MSEEIAMRFEAPKGTRLHRYFWSVTLTDTSDNLWFNTNLGIWEEYRKHPEHEYSTHAPCRTLRAYKRMLRKYPEITGRSVLVNRYRGYDVYA